MAHTVRVTLQAIQEVSGPQYKVLIQNAGLDRFLAELPPDEWYPIATSDEMVNLYQTIYGMLGEVLTRMFHRHSGAVMAAQVLAGDWGRQMRKSVTFVPIADRMAWCVPQLGMLMSRDGTPATISEDAVAWYLTLESCYICRGISNARLPLCASSEALFKALAEAMTGQRVRVAEVTCMATGAAHCKYAFYKPVATPAPVLALVS
jgi:predicted hydrocarbon binding protein